MTSSQFCFADEKKYGDYTLSEWSQIVKSGNYKTLGQPVYVNGLIEIIKDDSAPWPGRRQAAETLGRIGSDASDAIPVLKQLLNNPGDDPVTTRLWVLKSLSLFGTVASELEEDVRDVLLDQNNPHLVRVNSMETLGRIGQRGTVALPTFLKILEQPPTGQRTQRDELRVAAVEGLWILGPGAAPALSALVDAAREDWVAMRLAAMTTIGQVGPRAEIAIPTIVETILFDTEGEVREAAADALGKIGKEAFPTLKHLQKDREVFVRQLVLRALWQMDTNQEVLNILKNSFNDASEILSTQAAADYLSRIPEDEESYPLLLERLSSSNRRARLIAYVAINEHLRKSPSLQKDIQRLASDKNSPPQIRTTAEKLLRKLDFETQDSN